MKDTPQDQQSFDAAFDARCRELLQSSSVPAPDFVEPAPLAFAQGRKLALLAGVVIAVGLGAALWPSGEQETGKTPLHTPDLTTAEPQSAVPSVEVPVAETTTVAQSAEEEVVQPSESVPVSVVEEKLASAPKSGDASAEMAASPAVSQGNSLETVSAPSNESPVDPTTETTADVESDGVPDVSTTSETENASQVDSGDSPSEDTAVPVSVPAVLPEPEVENEEPTLRLPLTLPAGGGQ